MSTTTHPRGITGHTHDDLVDHLVTTRAIRRPAWEAAFRATPPPQLRHDPTTEHLTHTGSESAPGLDTAHPSHRLSVLARMLEALDLHDRHRVLHLGADTDYVTALLRHRLHSDTPAVTILRSRHTEYPTTEHEFDPGRLVVARDGAALPDDATFDRIIATSGVPRIPAAWVQHTRSGGVIVATIGHGLIRLDVTTPGTTPATATGHFLRTTTHLPTSTIDGHTTQHDPRPLPPRHANVPGFKPRPRTLRADVDALLRSLVGPEHEDLVRSSDTLHAAVDQLDPRWARSLPVEP